DLGVHGVTNSVTVIDAPCYDAVWIGGSMKFTPTLLASAFVLALSFAVRADDVFLGPVVAIKRTTKFDAALCKGKWQTDASGNILCMVEAADPKPDAKLGYDVANQWVTSPVAGISTAVGEHPVAIIPTVKGYEVLFPAGAKKFKITDA